MNKRATELYIAALLHVMDAVKVRIKIGKGVTGAVRYVMGPGHDPKTGHFLPAGAGSSRVAWIGGRASVSRSRARPTSTLPAG